MFPSAIDILKKWGYNIRIADKMEQRNEEEKDKSSKENCQNSPQ